MAARTHHFSIAPRATGITIATDQFLCIHCYDALTALLSLDGRSLARRVTTGAQLVDAISTAASALPGPSAQSTAALTCLAAVADALNELPEQVSPVAASLKHSERSKDSWCRACC